MRAHCTCALRHRCSRARYPRLCGPETRPMPRRRAGLKLEAALDAWGLDVAGLRCLDAGVSTGGFADCLLQRCAAAVVGVDVGYGQARARSRHGCWLRPGVPR